MIVHYEDQLADAPKSVIDLSLQGHLELRKSYPYPLGFITGKERILWNEVEGAGPISVLLWHEEDDGRIWWIDLAYTLPSARDVGAYKPLRKQLEGYASASVKCRSIQSHVLYTNERMQEIAQKAGSKFHSIKLHKQIK